ncbi:pentatricopeptide repeat-containing protein At5g06540-like [Salvia hispanica]|uniref:pentatricopeptide repeat-containing protein At5g06540-like n=1 Tax=Salvia hispanica TaxID=49212 RepID=UPI0020093C6B|nr:pentatricopeptide repeat-containing protein At5g06540-like [Salvia hispanica]
MSKYFSHDLKSIQRALLVLYHQCSIPQLKQIHSNLTVTGAIRCSSFFRKLIARFAILDFSHAVALLRVSPHLSASGWNTAISASSQNHPPGNAFLLFKHMIHHGFSPDNYTFSFIFRACAQFSDVVPALMCHTLVIKLGWERHDYVQNGLVHCYASSESIEFARKVFDESPDRDVITWTALINGYLKRGELRHARELFDEMPHRNAASWSSMINGYAQMGMFVESLQTFSAMLISGTQPNYSAIVGALSACSYLGALAQGVWIHAYIDRRDMELDGVLGTALVDMYAKCGCIGMARDVFDKIPYRDVFAYTSLISGLADHGESNDALEVFRRMEDEGHRPNEVTFVCVLCACSRAGLVEEGLRIFKRMKDVYGIEARQKHYGCLVDLLGRAGMVDEAEKVVADVWSEGDVCMVGALVNAWRVHGGSSLEKALVVDGLSEQSGTGVLVSNIYASLNKWEDVERVRKDMAERKVKKIGGCSLVELDGVVLEFGTGDTSAMFSTS